MNRGPKFVSGEVVDQRMVLTREDGSVSAQPVLFVSGGLVDNGDSTFSPSSGS